MTSLRAKIDTIGALTLLIAAVVAVVGLVFWLAWRLG